MQARKRKTLQSNTAAGALLAEHRIGAAQLAIAAGVSEPTVYKAMDPERWQRMRVREAMAVRGAAERLLAACGWKGDPAGLWREFEREAA